MIQEREENCKERSHEEARVDGFSAPMGDWPQLRTEPLHLL